MTVRSEFAVFILFFLVITTLSYAGQTGVSPEEHILAGERFFQNKQYFNAVREYEKALGGGEGDFEILRKLALMYYETGFLEEASTALRKAVSLNPGFIYTRMELGIVSFARGDLDLAREQFMAVLGINPGMSTAYYYLGEIFYREGDYKKAWLLSKIGQCLGHAADDLLRKIAKFSDQPPVDPSCSYHGDDLYIRQILVSTQDKAERVLKRLSEGELFEDVAAREDEGMSAGTGGFLGRFKPSEIHPLIAEELARRSAFSTPIVVSTEYGFHVVQRIAPFDLDHLLTLPVRPVTTAVQEGGDKKEGGEGTLKPHPEKVEKPPSRDAEHVKEKGRFLVFAGSYQKRENAEEVLNRLVSLGYPAYLSDETTRTGRSLFTVVAGKYDSLQKARETGREIEEAGFENFIHVLKKDSK